MANTPEGKVKKEIDKYLTSLGANWWGFKPMMSGYGRKGIPDIIGCYKGHFVAIEVKAENGKLTPWQRRELDSIITSSGHCMIAYSVEHVERNFYYWFGLSTDYI